jgi:hypothetical protein
LPDFSIDPVEMFPKGLSPFGAEHRAKLNAVSAEAADYSEYKEAYKALLLGEDEEQSSPGQLWGKVWEPATTITTNVYKYKIVQMTQLPTMLGFVEVIENPLFYQATMINVAEQGNTATKGGISGQTLASDGFLATLPPIAVDKIVPVKLLGIDAEGNQVYWTYAPGDFGGSCT